MFAIPFFVSVRLIKPEGRLRAASETPGLIREEAIATAASWTGVARTAPGAMSAWHHHGDWETVAYVVTGAVRLESGALGQDVVVGEPGDVIHIPAHVVHRESNPADVEQRLIVMRTGAGPIVTNVEAPSTRPADSHAGGSNRQEHDA